MNRRHSKLIVAARDVMIVVFVTCLFIVIVEGLSSIIISSFQMLQNASPREVSRYDKFLGWTAIPSMYIPDMYGHGKYVRTNARGFRSDSETGITEPDSKIRIICSGDSFTYGQGVANNHTWCHHIAELNNALDTVNLALPGYGVDQMYLRYFRDGTGIEHSIHIFAFIVGDLIRMASREQLQYGKPVMRFDEDALVVDNVPVPRWRWSVSRLLSRADYRTVDLAKRIAARLKQPKVNTLSITERIGPVALKIFQTIQQKSEEMGVITIFVFLPTEGELLNEHSLYRWVVANMETLDLPFIDLIPSLRAVPAGRAGSFFIAPGVPAAGHYTDAGNEWVAELLYDHLMAFPQVEAKLLGRVDAN